MRHSRAPFSEPAASCHVRSWVDFITTTFESEFLVHTAIEPVIGHLKEHHRMGRNHLAHPSGDAINPVLAATTSAACSRG